jgi:hypothetical protein
MLMGTARRMFPPLPMSETPIVRAFLPNEPIFPSTFVLDP